jgi:hypothetical protein
MAMALNCPQCGGANVSGRCRPLLVSVAVLFVLFASLQAAKAVCLPGLGLAVLVAMPISLFCLLATAAIAISGKRRCRDCGNGVAPGSVDAPDGADQSFPTGISALCVAILFAALVVGRPLILGLAGIVWWVLVLEAFMVLVLWAVSTGLLLIGQAVAFRMLQSWVRGAAAWAVLFLVPASALAASGVWWSLQTAAAFRHSQEPQVKAETILKHGRLASLPQSATEINVYNWSSPFSGEWYLSFRAGPEDIDKFLAESPSLQGQEAAVFTPERMRLPESLRRKGADWLTADPNTYFWRDPMTPEWFNPEIRERGRAYGIPPQNHHNWGQVIVNDAEHVVYVKVVWS